jgi:hypothetical protein
LNAISGKNIEFNSGDEFIAAERCNIQSPLVLRGISRSAFSAGFRRQTKPAPQSTPSACYNNKSQPFRKCFYEAIS